MKSQFSILLLSIIIGISAKAQQCCTPVIEYSSITNASQLPEFTQARDQIKTSGTVDVTLSTGKTFKAGKSILLQPNTHIKIDPSAPTAYFKAQIGQCTLPADYKLSFGPTALVCTTTTKFTLDITNGNGPFTIIWLGGSGNIDTGYRGKEISVPTPPRGIPFPDSYPVAVKVIDECYGNSKALDIFFLSCSGRLQASDNSSAAIDPFITEKNNYNIYPNPTSGSLTINWDNVPIASGEVIVMNKLMQVVYHKLVSDTNVLTVNLEYLPDDMYFVTIRSSGQSYTTKVILKK
jgi:hypothetical protein